MLEYYIRKSDSEAKIPIETERFFSKRLIPPLVAYAALVLGVIVFKFSLGQSYAPIFSAALMLLIPFLLGCETKKILRFNPRGFSTGVSISALVLFLYLIFFYIFSEYSGKAVKFEAPPHFWIFAHLVIIAFPEEFFFRGYLQSKFGGGFYAIVLASVLFSLAHFFATCVFSEDSCTQNILTFFPSLVMGYLYMKTGSIWSSVFFHFSANIVYLSLSSV